MPVKLTYSLLCLLTIALVTSAASVRHQYLLAHSAPTADSVTSIPICGPVQIIPFTLYDIGIYLEETP